MSIETLDKQSNSPEVNDQAEGHSIAPNIVEPPELAKTAYTLLENAGGKQARVRRDMTYGTQTQTESSIGFASARETSVSLASEDQDVSLFGKQLSNDLKDGLVIKTIRFGYDTKQEFEQKSGEEKPLSVSKFVVLPDGEIYMIRSDEQLKYASQEDSSDTSRIVPVEHQVQVASRIDGYLRDFPDYPSQEQLAA